VGVARHLDLVALALALPVFIVVGAPALGYAVAAGAWLAGRAIKLAADRHSARALGRADRRSALGALAFATLARVWLLAMAILLVGLAEREAGLAAAVLAAWVVTAYLAGQAVVHLLEPGEEGR
jgi:hypothetical protein